MAIQAHVSVLKAPPVYKWKTPFRYAWRHSSVMANTEICVRNGFHDKKKALKKKQPLKDIYDTIIAMIP